MISCVRCNNPLAAEEVHWVKRKSVADRAPLCQTCVDELRQKKAKPKPAPITTHSISTLRTSPSPSTSNLTANPQIITINAILILILFAFLAAPLLGVVVALVGNFIYLIILFPTLTGAIGGYIVNKGVRWGKLRDPLTAAFFGIIFGMIAYISYRVTDYTTVRYSAQASLMEEYGADAATANVVFNEILYEETGYRGFIGLVMLDAKDGMSISHRNVDGSINIGTTLTWIYWLFEMGAFTLFPALMAHAEAKRPFCMYHNRWYDKEKSLGGIQTETAEDTLVYLEEGYFNTFGKSLSRKVPLPGIEVCIEQCPNCQESMPVLTIKAVRKGSRGSKDEKIIWQQPIDPTQSDQLQEGAKQAHAFKK